MVADVKAALTRAAAAMARGANRRRREAEIVVGRSAWLSTEHLHLPPALTRKLAPKFVGPFPVLDAVTATSFRLDLPSTWRIHPVFHVS